MPPARAAASESQDDQGPGRARETESESCLYSQPLATRDPRLPRPANREINLNPVIMMIIPVFGVQLKCPAGLGSPATVTRSGPGGPPNLNDSDGRGRRRPAG